MNKKIISLTVASLFTVGAIGGAGLYIKSNLDKREEFFKQTISKISKDLPQNIKLTQETTNKGLFETSGKINVAYTFDDKTLNLLNEYTIKHGPTSWFGGDFQFQGTTKVNGTLASLMQFKTSEPIFETFQGTIKEDGSFNLNSKFSNSSFTINQNVLNNQPQQPTEKNDIPQLVIKFNNGTSKTSFSASSGEISQEITFPQVLAEVQPDSNFSIKISDFSGNYSFNIKETNTGKFSYKIGALTEKTNTVSFKNAEFNASILKNKDKYDISTGFKIADLNVLTQKNSQIDIAYSINGINNSIIDFYNEAYNSYKTKKEPTKEDTNKINDLILKTLKSGITFNINRIKLKNANNLIDFNGSLEITPAIAERAFLISEHSKILTNLVAEGELAQLGYSAFGSILNLEEGEAIKDNVLKLNFSYSDNKGIINGKEAPQEIANAITSSLKQIDLKLGLITESVANEEPDKKEEATTEKTQ